MGGTEAFERERARLVGLAAKVLGDRSEAEDVVQQAWLRLHRVESGGGVVDDLPAWLTTVTTRLCLDRLRARVPVPHDDLGGDAEAGGGLAPDPAEEVALADTVGVALHAVLDRLTPRERVAFVLHDSFGFDFPTIAGVLDATPASARQLASRARAKVRQPAPEDALADWEVVDAFMDAARGGDLDRLLRLLAPDAVVGADAAALAAGTPGRIEGREAVAAFFDGSAQATLAVACDGRPASAWFHRGEARVVFDFTVADGQVRAITFRAEPDLLARVVRRSGPAASHPAPPARQSDDTPPTPEETS